MVVEYMNMDKVTAYLFGSLQEKTARWLKSERGHCLSEVTGSNSALKRAAALEI